MWFRNLQIFRLTSDWAYGAEALSAALHKGLFHGCGATDRVARGWVPPRDEPGELVFSVDRQQLIVLGVEQKLLPASVVRQYAQARLVGIEAAQGYKPGGGTVELRAGVPVEREDVPASQGQRVHGRRTRPYPGHPGQ